MTIYKQLLKTALAGGLLRGTVSYSGATYPCNHSPISETPVLSSDGGGFTNQSLVTIVVDADDAPAGTFAANRAARLTAADGREYPLRIVSLDASGCQYFSQFTARHEKQGA